MYKKGDYIVSKTNDNNLTLYKLYKIKNVERYSNGMNRYVHSFTVVNDIDNLCAYKPDCFFNLNESHKLYKKCLLHFIKEKSIENDFYAFLSDYDKTIDIHVRNEIFCNLLYGWCFDNKIRKEWVDNSSNLNIHMRDMKIKSLGI